MSLTIGRATLHIKEQVERLAATKQREFWPHFLFHTTHVTNAVGIVERGALGARNLISNFHDVANQGALGAFQGSHDYARFYFRPKNGFHLRTEGIKCLCDPFRLANQMSVPVCFVFPIQRILCRPDACFTTGNVQRSQEFLTGDAAFDTLDFNAIYHDHWLDASNKEYILDRRMAEVAVKGELPLANNLHSIVFRTIWDAYTFRHMLGERGISCPYPLATEQPNGSLFMSQGMYITDLKFSDDRINLSFQFPLRNGPSDNIYDVCVVQEYAGGRMILDQKLLLDKPTLSIGPYKADPNSIWTIHLEKVLAFKGRLQHAKSQLFG
ncbi:MULTISPECIES: DarT ssDNA thymidine ADP-ribosyltransferase family protein [unclassified Bradyrhizobium]|uniref:DarT ssDNA thymidine ADP-ribosyltransferase family protein n=1 Tax=unclassified Bradyrhizobium TaxID=2631580 RepID=UPI002916D82C|nr:MULTISPECIES: DarT ssDNA thymidine ADP-ribosyltransferase family protein [unclassified Bradyrhizobium]